MDQTCISFKADGVRCAHRRDSRRPIAVCGVHWNVYKDEVEQRGVEYALQVIEEYNGRKRRGREAREARGEHAYQRDLIRLAADIVRDAIDGRLVGLRFEANQAPRAPAVPPQRAPVPVPEMAIFAQDRQNVHTTTAVNQMKKMLEVILKIPVPEHYRWNMRRCSKTPGEIIAACELSIAASRTMMDKYTLDTVIYEMGDGIYGRVLDCVWQYIKSSPDKIDLCKILRTEMEDNIGMCEQGNLTRLTNILAGYLDGVGGKESHAEMLGREFPRLWDIDNEDERVAEGNRILDKVGVTDRIVRNEWIQSLY